MRALILAACAVLAVPGAVAAQEAPPGDAASSSTHRQHQGPTDPDDCLSDKAYQWRMSDDSAGDLATAIVRICQSAIDPTGEMACAITEPCTDAATSRARAVFERRRAEALTLVVLARNELNQ